MARCYDQQSIAGCDEGGETHKFNLESRVIELPRMNMAQRIWKQINAEYIPDGSKEVSNYFCEWCNLQQTRVRVLDKNTKRYGPYEHINPICHKDHL